MLKCLSRVFAPTRSSAVGAVRHCALGKVEKPTSDTSDSRATDEEVTPYPRLGVLDGCVNGVRVDFARRPEPGKRIIDRIMGMPRNNEYRFAFRSMKDYLNSDAVSPATRKTFMLKYAHPAALRMDLLLYLYEIVKSSQDPTNRVLNTMELEVAMLAYRTYTTKMHMKRNPGDREVKRRHAIIHGKFIRKFLVLMQVNFERANFLLTELGGTPPIALYLRSSYKTRSKPPDPEKSLKYYKKVFARIEAKAKKEKQVLAEETAQKELAKRTEQIRIREAKAAAAALAEEEGKLD